ncbi:trimethylamine methyltransferase family protein, partial [Zavarzinia sp.]|uniref:trimethylamine methyltransferase family protein n=1 Tax=Zavarzinia sp. TaxID=2027920 RepID=UPI00356711A3
AKPIVYVTLNDMTAHLDVTDMAEAVVGGREALTERPLVACYKNTLFPLVHNAEAVRTLLDLAGRGLPCIYSPVSTAGTVAPMTVLGATVVVNAGVLAGLVMAQLKREGAPYIAIGWAGEVLDMRTMVDIFAWPDHRAVYSSLLHWYDLPMWTLGGVTDSKLPDQQAAAEAALTLLADAVSGGHMIHDIGFMESAYTGSLASTRSSPSMKCRRCRPRCRPRSTASSRERRRGPGRPDGPRSSLNSRPRRVPRPVWATSLRP